MKGEVADRGEMVFVPIWPSHGLSPHPRLGMMIPPVSNVHHPFGGIARAGQGMAGQGRDRQKLASRPGAVRTM